MSVQVKLDPGAALERIAGSGARLALAQAVLDLCAPYVPVRTGRLRASACASEGGVVYGAPYARYPYYRGAYWDRRMLAAGRGALAQRMAEQMGGSAK